MHDRGVPVRRVFRRRWRGDGGVGEVNEPESVAVDSSGNLLIADTGNNRMRKGGSASGIITTVAGNGFT
jgi:DNA-binding beta-propeller fold protein YncE